MEESNFIYPRRLVMISAENDCMFCKDPKGYTYTYHVCLYDRLGYITCEKCKEKGKAEVLKWHETVAYGRVRHLKDVVIKVKRSLKNGIRAIEDGWKLEHPITRIQEGNEMIYCFNETQKLGRWCYIDEILELNPPKGAV